MERRTFLKSSSIAVAGVGGLKTMQLNRNKPKETISFSHSLNAYSFNKQLLEGSMSLQELFRYAKLTGFAAVDLTAYYIAGYPELPDDDILYGIKKMAYGMGMAISGTGVRNDFTVSDAGQLTNELNLVKEWIIAATKMGAPHIRVFAGRGTPAENDRPNVKIQVIQAMQECADFASDFGVTVGFQNHNDAIKTTSDIIEVLESVKSDWFGLMLDIGSIVGSDPYGDIQRLIPYATSWQVKENILSGSKLIPTDFEKLIQIVQLHRYQGYFPLETLGEGNPRKKVRKLYQNVTRAMV